MFLFLIDTSQQFVILIHVDFRATGKNICSITTFNTHKIVKMSSSYSAVLWVLQYLVSLVFTK